MNPLLIILIVYVSLVLVHYVFSLIVPFIDREEAGWWFVLYIALSPLTLGYTVSHSILITYQNRREGVVNAGNLDDAILDALLAACYDVGYPLDGRRTAANITNYIFQESQNATVTSLDLIGLMEKLAEENLIEKKNDTWTWKQ